MTNKSKVRIKLITALLMSWLYIPHIGVYLLGGVKEN